VRIANAELYMYIYTCACTHRMVYSSFVGVQISGALRVNPIYIGLLRDGSSPNRDISAYTNQMVCLSFVSFRAIYAFEDVISIEHIHICIYTYVCTYLSLSLSLSVSIYNHVYTLTKLHALPYFAQGNLRVRRCHFDRAVRIADAELHLAHVHDVRRAAVLLES